MDLPGFGMEILSVFEKTWQAIGVMAAVVGLAVIGALRIYPPWSLIYWSLFRQQALGRLNATGTLLHCLAYALKTDGLYAAARLRIELEAWPDGRVVFRPAVTDAR